MTESAKNNPNTGQDTGQTTPFHYTDAATGLTYSGIIEDIDGERHVVYLDDGKFNEDVEDGDKAESEDD